MAIEDAKPLAFVLHVRCMVEAGEGRPPTGNNHGENCMTLRLALIVGLALVCSGCAVSRGEMALSVAPAPVATSDGTPVYIDQITDQRRFEDKPSDPSTPSLKGGKGSTESDAIKSKAVARKRNGYGMAMGDILLEGDQTVAGVMRDLLREGLNGAGYYVVDDRSKLGTDGLEIDVVIEKFWAWFTPGFWSVKMESQIETALTVTQNGAERQVEVRAYGQNSGQSGREGNWVEAYQRGFEDYKTKIATAF